MKTKNKVALLAFVSLVATGYACAEDANVNVTATAEMNGQPGMGRPPREGMGIMNKIWGPDRQEVRQEFRDEKHQAIDDFKQGMEDRRDYMKGSSTPGMATPTPWKDFRNNMKDIREDMRGKMASITSEQTATLAAKLGISVEALKAQLASGTPLHEIVKDKISKEELEKIMPMMFMKASTTASGTMMREPRRPQGFFNQLRMKLFGGDTSTSAEVSSEMEMNTNGEVKAEAGFRGFFKKWFNF